MTGATHKAELFLVLPMSHRHDVLVEGDGEQLVAVAVGDVELLVEKALLRGDVVKQMMHRGDGAVCNHSIQERI